MTPEEMMRQLDRQNREAIKQAGGVDSEIMVKLLNEASLRGFKLGGDVALATFQGLAAVKKAAA